MLSSTVPSFQSPPKPRNLPHNHASADSSSTPMPEKAKIRGSPQLNRWSRARSIRSGRRLDRKSMAAVTANPNPPVLRDASDFSDGSESSSDEEVVGKSIYMVSDGTGWTAEHSINAALAQFEHCLVDRVCPINTHLFSGVEDVERLVEIVKQAAKEGALLVYTLADSSMCEAAKSACKIWNVPSIDVLGPITEAISRHLEVSPLGVPRSGRNPLSEDYFKRIEAIEFTIKQDDGALPMNLKNADIILAGVSRTGKTPLSIYLAQKGYKVANIPIVMGVALPSSLFAVSPRKVFGLTINPLVLQAIRKARAKTLGLTADDQVRTNYAEMEYVREELQNARKIFSQNPTWPVIEVTGKAIEETAAIILRLFHDRNHKCSMPRISKRY